MTYVCLFLKKPPSHHPPIPATPHLFPTPLCKATNPAALPPPLVHPMPPYPATPRLPYAKQGNPQTSPLVQSGKNPQTSPPLVQSGKNPQISPPCAKGGSKGGIVSPSSAPRQNRPPYPLRRSTPPPLTIRGGMRTGRDTSPFQKGSMGGLVLRPALMPHEGDQGVCGGRKQLQSAEYAERGEKLL